MIENVERFSVKAQRESFVQLGLFQERHVESDLEGCPEKIPS
jgi:hypothetical protein